MVQIIEENRRPQADWGKALSGLAQQYGQYQQGKRQQEQQRQQQAQQLAAAEKLGIDPEILSLPKEAQAAYFKNQFAQEKPLTSLQQSQQKLNEERLNSLQSQKKLYQRLTSKQEGEVQAGTEQGQNVLSSMSEDNLNQLAAFSGQPGEQGVIGNIAKSEIERRGKEREFEHRMQTETRKEEFELVKPVILELNQARKNIPLQEQAIEDIKNAAPEVGSLDYLADVTGFEPLRSAQGAKLKTAIKDFFLSDLTRVGARPNQWIEQQLADALPKIGRSKEANLITAEGMRFKVDLAKKRIEILDDLLEKDRDKGGYRGDVDARASKLMRPYIEERKKELQESIKQIKASKPDQAKATVRMISPEGELYEIEAGDVEEAEANGFKHS